MEPTTFQELQRQIQEHYQSGDYAAALELATRETNQYPEYAHLLYYWRSAMAARLGDLDQAISLLEAVLKTGFWYGERLLRKNKSFQQLQGHPAFEDLIERSARLQAEDQEALFPLLVLRSQGNCQAGGPPCPLLLGLHTNLATARDSIGFWQPIAQAGWLVGAPQSTQAMWKGAYVWEDRDQAAEDVRKHLAALFDKYAIDPGRVVLAGHSLGGEAAVWMALTGAIPAQGFIAVGLAGPLTTPPGGWLPFIRQAVRRDGGNQMRGYLLVGEEDETVALEGIQELGELLLQEGIACELESVPLVGSDYSPEYEAAMLRALDFVSGS